MSTLVKKAKKKVKWLSQFSTHWRMTLSPYLAELLNNLNLENGNSREQEIMLTLHLFCSSTTHPGQVTLQN